ncbi:unnamed protein product [Rotaria socialis]|uniref:Uncharacterized protein n=1 Tax=Rotaria socialis TaxID=392032 RepID=A0A818NC11_9BILA|nr:unnamed protein product [Rotaria socialis]CAF4717311.1 unnamed protein product [Rotaria socialis]
MTSKACNGSHPWNANVNSSPETIYHFPESPGEPGKFDFYRVYLSFHTHNSDPTLSGCSDEPTISAPSTISSSSSSSVIKRRWTPFADILSSDESKSSILTSSQSSNSISAAKPQAMSSINSDGLSNVNGTEKEPIQSAQSLLSLTDAVKNSMNKGQLSANSNKIRRPFGGTTLSSKDLNHLSPQSM